MIVRRLTNFACGGSSNDCTFKLSRATVVRAASARPDGELTLQRCPRASSMHGAAWAREGHAPTFGIAAGERGPHALSTRVLKSTKLLKGRVQRY